MLDKMPVVGQWIRWLNAPVDTNPSRLYVVTKVCNREDGPAFRCGCQVLAVSTQEISDCWHFTDSNTSWEWADDDFDAYVANTRIKVT